MKYLPRAFQLYAALQLFCEFHLHSFIFQVNKHPFPISLRMAGVPVVPYYPSKSSKDYQWMDIYNALGRDRTLFVGRFLDEENCNQLIASLIWLQGYMIRVFLLSPKLLI